MGLGRGNRPEYPYHKPWYAAQIKRLQQLGITHPYLTSDDLWELEGSPTGKNVERPDFTTVLLEGARLGLIIQTRGYYASRLGKGRLRIYQSMHHTGAVWDPDPLTRYLEQIKAPIQDSLL